MTAVISAHNKRVLSSKKEVQSNPGCNCRAGVDTCPMRGKCLEREMVYKAAVRTNQGSKHYFGQTARTFKERHYGHTSDLRHREKINSTALSKFVWKYRDITGEDPEIVWSKLQSAKPYSLGSRKCSLCLSEKIAIAKDKSGNMINRRREIMNRCLHKDRCKLSELITVPTTIEEDNLDEVEETQDVSLEVQEDLDVEQLQDVSLEVHEEHHNSQAEEEVGQQVLVQLNQDVLNMDIEDPATNVSSQGIRDLQPPNGEE